MKGLIQATQALDFIIAGKSLFTLKSLRTEKHFTYKVTAPKNVKKDYSAIFFVEVLSGIDNTSSYTYIGFIRQVQGIWTFIYDRKSRFSAESTSVVAFMWCFNNFYNKRLQLNTVQMFHEGKCCRCRRILTHPESIVSGIGPECYRASMYNNKKYLSM